MDGTILCEVWNRGLFFETVDNSLNFEKRIDELSYKHLIRVWKNSFFLKCSHYNSGVIGVQVTLQNTHWKGGADAPLFPKPYKSCQYHAVKGKSHFVIYKAGFFFILVYIHPAHEEE